MDTERLRTLAEQFERMGVGGLFTSEQMRELCSLALEAAALLESQPAPEPPRAKWEPVSNIARWDEAGMVKISVIRGIDGRSHVVLDDGHKRIECVWPRNWRIQRRPSAGEGP